MDNLVRTCTFWQSSNGPNSQILPNFAQIFAQWTRAIFLFYTKQHYPIQRKSNAPSILIWLLCRYQLVAGNIDLQKKERQHIFPKGTDSKLNVPYSLYVNSFKKGLQTDKIIFFLTIFGPSKTKTCQLVSLLFDFGGIRHSQIQVELGIQCCYNFCI